MRVVRGVLSAYSLAAYVIKDGLASMRFTARVALLESCGGRRGDTRHLPRHRIDLKGREGRRCHRLAIECPCSYIRARLFRGILKFAILVFVGDELGQFAVVSESGVDCGVSCVWGETSKKEEKKYILSV